MSWSAIIIVNFVCDIYVHIILLLDYALICTHFGRFLNEFDFWSFCVQQFWACKFTVLLCLLVRRREAKRVEERRSETKRVEETRGVCVRQFVYGWHFFGHLVEVVAKCDDIKFYMEMETELIYIRIVEWGVGLADDQTVVCRVCRRRPYLRSLQFAMPRNCVVLTYHSVQWWTARRLWYNRLVLCELEFSLS